MIELYTCYVHALRNNGFFKRNDTRDRNYLNKLVRELKKVSPGDSEFHAWLYKSDGKSISKGNISILLREAAEELHD